MPTTLPRYTVTETPEIARALDAAAAEWPELRGDRAALLRRLVEAGRQSVTHKLDEHMAARRQAIRNRAGAATGAYPAEAAETLKTEWPE